MQAQSQKATFYWHDYETFGLMKHVDRPAQFAGQRTDLNFEPVDAPDQWFCRPSPDYLPSPEACLVTGITPQTAAQKGLPEAEFARRIHERFNVPETLVIGYNNLRFDDEVSRALFWRNFLDMYSHQFRNGCSRWDLYPFTLAVWALRDEGTVWPTVTDEDGTERVTFRLEKLTQANGIVHTHAHDAVSDVEATYLFAKHLAKVQPRLWKWALDNRGKDAVSRALTNGAPCVYVDPYAGQKAGFLRFVMPICTSPQNRNEVLCWDCRYDPSVLDGLPPQEIRRLAMAGKEERREGESRLPLVRVKVNQCPFVCADLRIINARVAERFAIDVEAVLANGVTLAQITPRIQGPCLQALEMNDADRPEPVDPEEALYSGFMCPADEKTAAEVRRLLPEELATRHREGRIVFENPVFEELLFRMRARSWPETLDADEAERFKNLARRLLSGEVPGRRVPQAYFDAIDTLVAKNDALLEEERISQERAQERSDVLEALYNWGEFVMERIEENPVF